jgi:hypothetical protein
METTAFAVLMAAPDIRVHSGPFAVETHDPGRHRVAP